jgi:uncharacterized membrane protein (DUF2068 family)
MQLIIAYKAIRGALLMLIALAMSIAVSRGQGHIFHGWATALRESVSHRLAVEAAEFLLSVATPSHLALTSLALGLDGAVGIVEAWLLNRGTRLAIWLVVCATSVLIPWELYELVAHFRPLRVVILIVNVVVVLYLGFQANKHVAHRQRLLAH